MTIDIPSRIPMGSNSIEFVLIDGYYTQVITFEKDHYATNWIYNYHGRPVLITAEQFATMVSVPATITFMALNGHLLVSNVNGIRRNGALNYTQWNAECAHNCNACRNGETLGNW